MIEVVKKIAFERLEKNPIKYLIVGTGRCGTGFISKYMSSAGIKCGHENYFTPISGRGFDNDYEAECSFMALPFLKELDCQIVHVLRHPVNTINSMFNCGVFQNTNNEHTKFIQEVFPEIAEAKDVLHKCLLWYLLWNEYLEKEDTVLVCRIEGDLDILAGYLGLDPEVKPLWSDMKYNTVEHKKRIAFDDIKKYEETKRLIEFADRYNYKGVG